MNFTFRAQGNFEVTANGKLIHSKKTMGQGKCTDAAETQKLIDAVQVGDGHASATQVPPVEPLRWQSRHHHCKLAVWATQVLVDAE